MLHRPSQFYAASLANIMFLITELMRLNQISKSLSWPLQGFTGVKNTIFDASVLPYMLHSSTTIFLVTDASKVVTGGALNQVINSILVPVDFFSAKFSETQQRYSTFY